MVLSIMDPEGAGRRKRRRLKRRIYQNKVCCDTVDSHIYCFLILANLSFVYKGPDFVWHIDGYDKLKPYGFTIHGCIVQERRCKNLRVVWFDLKNAFGSVPHSRMFEMMEWLNVPESFITLSKDIYHRSTFRVRTSSGYTKDIPQNVGVKQGCPLSPLLFNLAIQGMLIGLDQVEDAGYKLSDGLTLKYLAYADDLCSFDHERQGIEHMIKKIREFCRLGKSHLQHLQVCFLISHQ